MIEKSSTPIHQGKLILFYIIKWQGCKRLNRAASGGELEAKKPLEVGSQPCPCLPHLCLPNLLRSSVLILSEELEAQSG